MSVFHEKLIESNILFASFTLYGSPVRTVLTICSQLKKYTVIKSQCLHKNELTIHCQPEWITKWCQKVGYANSKVYPVIRILAGQSNLFSDIRTKLN